MNGIAAGLDDIILAADEADEAGVIARGQVAGAEPSVDGKQAFGVVPLAPFPVSSFLVAPSPVAVPLVAFFSTASFQ